MRGQVRGTGEGDRWGTGEGTGGGQVGRTGEGNRWEGQVGG